MSTGAHIFAIQSTLNEIKNVSSGMLHTFIFNQNGEILAKDVDTDSSTACQAADTFNLLTEKADVIGGIEAVTFYGSYRRMNVSTVNGYYIVTVASKESEESYTSTLTRILIPTVLRIVDNLHVVPEHEPIAQLNEPAFSTNQTQGTEEASIDQTDKPDAVEPEPEIDQAEPELAYEPSLTEPSATQFLIENLGGLLVQSDTVRIDNAIISEWKDQYGDRMTGEVDVETLDGRATRCKLKPSKGSKLQGRGIIQMPQKIQLTLQTSEGELVMVKPVIE